MSKPISKNEKLNQFENFTEIELIYPKDHGESIIEAHKRHINELYLKEYEFSNKLKLLFEYYKYPLEAYVDTPKQIITQNEIDSIFKGISDIFQLSWTLCGELKVLIHSYTHGYSTVSIAGVFQKHAKQFKECYGRYASRYLFSIVTTHNLKKKNSNFKKFYKTIKKKFEAKKLELKTAFCLPIFQIQSYYDTFLRLQNNTSQEDKSYELLEDGKEFFYNLCQLLKESMKRSTKIKEVYAIQKSIKDCPTTLVHPYRILYKQFRSIIDANDPTCYIRLILFDDVIVIARKRKYHKTYVYDRAADYHVIQLIDTPSTHPYTNKYMFTLLILSPFNNNKDNFINNRNGGYNESGGKRNTDDDEILDRGETFTEKSEKKFSRFFSWTFNQNITRLTFVVEQESLKMEIMQAIQKRLKHLKPNPFEFLMLEAEDKYNYQQSMANLPQQISPLPENFEIILTNEICNKLYTSIPKRLRIKRSLTLIYSMQLHGSSLTTFYERSSAGYGTSQILVIRDTEDNIFGAYTSEPFKKHNGFYGNGETFLWKFEPHRERSRRRSRGSVNFNNLDSRKSKRITSIISQIKSSIPMVSSTIKKNNSLLRLSIQNSVNNSTEDLQNNNGLENNNNNNNSNNNNNNNNDNNNNDNDNGDSKAVFDRYKKVSRTSSGYSVATTATTTTTSSNFSTLSRSGRGGKVKLYLWKQTNYFFINSTSEYVSIGSGGGTNGLWFEQQMLHGRSQVCETFKNDILSSQENFEILDMELWSFTTQVEREVQRTRPSTFSTQK
ncbi:hypothetical protein BCR32DRAFT_272259 [Anaeromyces robustus]|uniref:Oxidation resistance protein 1 n=1 Tax=Anaeromyces robustus TaxID=1754192 RepID=A0A1Y1WHF2_9FUNG|nr:hypothetical protein BCR32DRAFT_272259 [Anaeromyces robustus]|eukprot:ORX72554.1 hypothetical protein BCR32DRAFT_272259 [Anaeromyces robustus]